VDLESRGVAPYRLARVLAELSAREGGGGDNRRSAHRNRPTANGYLASFNSLPKRDLREYRSGKRHPGPAVSFRMGEALAELGVAGACGPLALVVAGHGGQFLQVLRNLNETPDVSKTALGLFENVPLIAADQGGLISRLEHARDPRLSDRLRAALQEMARDLGVPYERPTYWQPILTQARDRARSAKAQLAEVLSDQRSVDAMRQAFLKVATAPRRASTTSAVADRVLESVIALAQHDWPGAYRLAVRWHRLTCRELDPKRFYSSPRFPEIDSYSELLDLVDVLDVPRGTASA